MKTRLSIAAFLCVIFATALTSREPQSAPTPDPRLERRLTRDAFYRSRPRDTLERVAYYLYGKRSWWERLREQNPALRELGAHDRIPQATLIRYKAPEIGATYRVQPGDWLIRIVEWKYGDREKWEQVFQLNAKRLSNPNLIHPGDTIDLSADGRVTHRGTGAVLMNAEEQLKVTGSWFGLGFLIGLVALFVFGVVLRRVGAKDVPLLQRSFGPLGKVHEQAESETATKKLPRAPADPDDYPYGFKKRPGTIYRADWKPAADRDGQLQTGLGYLRISKPKSKSGAKTPPLKPGKKKETA